MTEEQCDQVFDLACEKYIEESRALDRYIDKKADKLLKAQDEVKNSNLSDKDKNELIDKLVKKANKTSVDHTFSDGYKRRYDTADINIHNKNLSKSIKDAGGFHWYATSHAGNLDDYGKPIKAGKSEIIHNKKRYDISPAVKKKPGKYLDMYNKKNEKSKFNKMIDEI